MENKNIIIILVVIIVILAAAMGIMFLNPMHAKEPTKIKVSSNKTLYEGDDLSVKLTDLNKTPLSKEKVNITIKNSKGKIVANKTVKTNDKGNAKLDLNLKKGKYDVSVSYAGNENYTGNNTTQKLNIKEKVAETQPTSSKSSSGNPYDINNLPPSNDPYPETKRYQIDENHVIQEYSDHYRSTVDLRTGERHGGFF
ncbi:carboxypeptidase-like regulatory domain-containing protein [uncultured Methanobrevibacter sp.]|uniref:carboxypeptidase-like regulatory domain-containing protein n=1 Tax=uncultured Methanobrevibacter sp. TaxID=253161 RepID=UPI0025F82E62|nr:carboxypeptidase-like regulatory domain-containing protein [uncultured Methanobrevibacter sp.]